MGRIDIYPTTAFQGPPSAQLGYAEVTADQTGITTPVDLTGLSVTVTVPAGRRIRIRGSVVQFTRTAGTVTYSDLAIYEGAQRITHTTIPINNTYGGGSVEAIITPSAGTHTYKLRASTDGTVTMEAQVDELDFILVEDITGTFWNGVPVTNPPVCRVFNSALQSIPNTTNTIITFDSERYDTDSMHSTSVSTGRITFNTAGVYEVTGYIVFAANASGNRQAAIRLNGSTFIGVFLTPNAAGDTPAITVATTYKFIVGDFVELLAFQNSGGALNVSFLSNYSPEFSATWVGLG